VSGGEPDIAGAVEHFASMSHDELYAGVRAMRPDLLAAAQRAWTVAAEDLAVARGDCGRAVAEALGHGWDGAAAAAARRAAAALDGFGAGVEEAMAEVGARLGQALAAAEAMRAAVPPPERPIGMETRPEAILDPEHAARVTAAHEAAERARHEAVRVLDRVYGSTFTAAAVGLPHFGDQGQAFTAAADATDASDAADQRHHDDAAQRPDAAAGLTGVGIGAVGAVAGVAALSEPERTRPPARREPVVAEQSDPEPAPTYLVEMDAGNRALVGSLPPASPPVVGVWDRER
jgi:hypothetical protein